MNEKESYQAEITKPALLYHASANRQIDEFEPRSEHIRDRAEGSVVFATPDHAFATCFIVDTDSSWANIGRFTTDGVAGPWHMIISDRDRFEELDHGGAIYALPSDTFSYKADIGVGESEWTSQVAVKPIDKENYGSGLEAMKAAGVVVYFIDKSTFDAIKATTDHGQSIIESLTPEE